MKEGEIMHDPSAEIRTLSDELAVTRRRMRDCGAEAKAELLRQQDMILRDIRRNRLILEDRSRNHLRAKA